MGYAAGYQAGLSTPGQFSSLGQALQQLLQMGFQTSERKGAENFAAGQAEAARGGAMQMEKLRGGQALEQIGATGEQSRMTQGVIGEEQRARDAAKAQAGQDAIKNFTKFLAAGHATGPEFLRAGLEAGIKDLNNDGVLTQQEIAQQLPARAQEAGLTPGDVSPATPPGGAPLAPGFGDRFRDVLQTPEGAAAFAGLEPSVQSGFKTAAEAGETSDMGILAQRALTDPKAATRLESVATQKTKQMVAEENTKFGTMKGMDDRAKAMREDVDQARNAYQGAIDGKFDMLAALLGDKVPQGLLGSDPKMKALGIRLAKEAYEAKADHYNTFIQKNKLTDYAPAGKGQRDLATDPEAAAIRDQVASGKLTKEQAKAKLIQMGF